MAWPFDILDRSSGQPRARKAEFAPAIFASSRWQPVDAGSLCVRIPLRLSGGVDLPRARPDECEAPRARSRLGPHVYSIEGLLACSTVVQHVHSILVEYGARWALQ